MDEFLPEKQEMLRQDIMFANETVEAEFQSLKFLRRDHGFYVQQEWEVLEYITTFWEQQNEYKIFDTSGNLKLMEAHEKTNVCCRLCCSEHRPFTFRLSDILADKNKPKKALVFSRKFRCCGWALFPCCAHEVDAHYMVDHKTAKSIGSTSQYTRAARVRVPWLGGGFSPKYHLEDYAGKRLAYISGPCCCVCDCCGASFKIHADDGKQIGHIQKLRPLDLKTFALELETEADNYQVKFDSDEVPFNLKLATLAATFLIDFNFFEDSRGLRQCRCCDMYLCGYSLPCIPACCFTYIPCCWCCRPNKKAKGTAGHRA